MNKIIEILNWLLIAAVFCLKVVYLNTHTVVLNVTAMILICLFIAIQAILVHKIPLMVAVFVFSLLAELLNLVFMGKLALTMILYPVMHIVLLVYLVKTLWGKKASKFFELPFCVFVMFVVYSWGFWQSSAFTYAAMLVYSILLCTNLTLSYGLNKRFFTGMLLVFMVDTIVVWSLVKGGGEVIRALCWLPFMAGEKCMREGALSK
jgi:hypothetical protein